MNAQFGDEVVITMLLPTGQIEEAAGILAPEMSGDGLVGLVVETDGGAVHIRPQTIVKMEVQNA